MNPFKEYFNKLFITPIIGILKELIIVKQLFKTIIKIVLKPDFLFTQYDEDKLLSPIRLSRTIMKLIFTVITIHVFFNISAESNFTQLFKEYFLYLLYIISLFLVIGMSYVFNYIGNLKLENTKIIADAFVNIFNFLYLIVLIICLVRVDLNSAIVLLVIFTLIFSVYYNYKIGKKLAFKPLITISFSIFISVLLIIILSINLSIIYPNIQTVL